MSAAEAEKELLDAAALAFEIIPSYFEEGERQAIAAVIARALLRLSPSIEKSPEVREMLAQYADSNKAFPYL